MTLLRILALLFVANLMIEALEATFGEPFTNGVLWGVLIFVSGHLLVQLWREQITENIRK